MIKGYDNLQLLHEGLKSTIYRAHSLDLNKSVIIKSLTNPFPIPIEIGRLRYEFEILKGLNIEGIPKTISFEKSDNNYFIVFEDTSAIPSKLFLKNSDNSLGSFLDIALKLCKIVSGIHSSKIIHKDINPSNIVVSTINGEIQLIDFCISAKLLSGSQESYNAGFIEGSLPYISPEQTGRMNRTLDYRSDLYSMGVTFFELITGQLPFNANHPLEWVHAHLAQPAPDPRLFRPDLPETIALIILKLLSKNAEERYQSAYNLEKDLEKCALQWNEKKSILPFKLSSNDTFGQFILPSKLYARNEQLKQLTEISNMVVEGNIPSFIVVSGYAGIGKTTLVQEARKIITIAKGNFIEGKFDQLNKGIPYSGFILCFTELARQLLAEKEEVLENIRSKLLNALSENTQIINQLIPAFENILGVHPEPPSLLPEEKSNRFLQTLKIFVKTLASKDKPLIVFIDDLQWADIASLTLVEALASDNELQNFGLICSYRSNEVDIAHPLMQSLNKVKSLIPFQDIKLTDLQHEDICDLLTDTFKLRKDETIGLATLLKDKTQGNPFFIRQSLSHLYEEGLIFFDSTLGKWNWNLDQLKSINISDNVLELMISKIKRLNPGTQKSLKLAACIGNEFSLNQLLNISDVEITSALKQALEQGLIFSLDENYVLLSDDQQFTTNNESNRNNASTNTDAKFKFLHDRVQQAAYSLLSKAQQVKIHYHLGQNLNRTLDEEQRIKQIFTICNHLNMASELIKEKEEIIELSGINLTAAKNALEATAYFQALEFSTKGISLLPSNPHKNQYSLWKQLHLIYAQCNYLVGNLSVAEKDYREILKHSQSRLDKLLVYRAMVDMYSSDNNQLEVIETVGAALSLFKIRLPKSTLEAKLRIMADIVKIKWGLRNKTMDDLVHAPRSKNEDHIKLAELLLEAGPSVYLSSQDLFAWMVLFEVRSALKLGNTPSTALGLTGYGMIMNTAFGDIDLAFKMADIGAALNKEFGNPFPYHKLRFVKLNFISHFKEDANKIVDEFPSLAKMALTSGDHLYLGLNYYNITLFKLGLGQSLDEIYEQSFLHLRQLKILNNFYGYDLLHCRVQSLLALQGKELIPWDESEHKFDFKYKIKLVKESKSLTNLVVLYISMFQTNYLLNQHEDNIFEIIIDATKYKEFVNNTYACIDLALYQSLACFKIYKLQSKKNQHKLLKIIKNNLNYFELLTKKSGIIYECHYLLLNAIFHLLKNQHDKGLQLFDNLLILSNQRNLSHLTAISKEIIGQVYTEKQQQKVASIYLRESLYEYNQWGATAKAKLMLDQYAILSLNKEIKFELNNIEDVNVSATYNNKISLDLSSLMKSATAISEEIVLNKLLPTMISIVVENAGAQIGYLILKKDNQIVLSAIKNVADREAELLNDIPLSESPDVSRTIIDYVHRINEIVLLENALNDERFKNDNHLQKNKVKSVICLPIMYKDQFKGALYLENNMVTHAFSKERVNVLQILCSQISISLENAILYRNLEDSLEKQVALTDAYSRFTPKEYLRFLGHSSILDVKLGDHRVENMTVLFSDIRSYTSIAEQLTAEENFEFLSTYLEKMTEIVSVNNGLVNQLLGDGILAFFDKPKDALNSAVEMQLLLQSYQIKNKEGSPIKIKAGIGLHSGEVIIGIVGNSQTMDTGIVSDTVNAAARIEGLTKFFGVNILLSEKVVMQLESEIQSDLRFIASVRMKGKKLELGVYECFNGDEEVLKNEKIQYKTDYEKALGSYNKGIFQEAFDQFSTLLEKSPSDRVLTHFQNKAYEMLNSTPPADWSPTEVMDFK